MVAGRFTTGPGFLLVLAFSTALTGAGPSPHEYLFFRYRDWRAVRHGRYKLVGRDARPLELYDLAADIGEKADLARQKPELVRSLRAQLDQWRAEVGD